MNHRVSKGWVVKPVSGSNKFRAYTVHGKKTQAAGTLDSYEIAVFTAIGAAIKRKTISQPLTRHWLAKKGMVLDNQCISDNLWRSTKVTSAKGWYVYYAPASGRNKTPCYKTVVGKSKKTGYLVGARIKREVAIQLGIAKAKETGFYNKEATIYWLKMNNYNHLLYLT